MAGHERGLAAQFNAVNGNRAPYSHCASHGLNLALMKACKVPEILGMMENLRFLGKFFEYPKRLRTLERIIKAFNETLSDGEIEISKKKMATMCLTRWIEKYTSLEDLHDMYVPITKSLQEIVERRDQWDNKAVVEANGLLANLSSSEFIAAFETVRYLFG